MNDDKYHNPVSAIPFSDLTDDDESDSEDELILDQLADATNNTINESSPPSVLGEQSVSGEMADPESDDDTLLNAQHVGLQVGADYDNPQELNTAEDVAEGERLHKSR